MFSWVKWLISLSIICQPHGLSHYVNCQPWNTHYDVKMCTNIIMAGSTKKGSGRQFSGYVMWLKCIDQNKTAIAASIPEICRFESE